MARTNRRRPDPRARTEARRGQAAGVARALARALMAVGVVGGVFAGVIGLYLWLTTSPRFAVAEVHVQGNQRAQLATLAPLTGVKRGSNIFLIDTDAARQRLEGHPWIRRASVSTELPQRLRVVVDEHVPEALVSLNGLYLVSDRAEVFKRASPGDPLDLPVITGVAWEGRPRAELEAELAEGLSVIRTYGKSPVSLRATLAEVHHDPVRGFRLIVSPQKGEWKRLAVHLGREGVEDRLSRLDGLMVALSQRGERPSEVFLDNGSRPEWVVVR